jgi:Methyltransferase domain
MNSSPIIDFPADPRPRDFSTSPHMRRLLAHLDARREEFRGQLRSFLLFLPALVRIAVNAPEERAEPRWRNDWLPGLDAISLYAYLATRNPRTYFEIGSGHSTRFARQAIRDNGLRTRIISVDPEPRASVDTICDELHRMRIEDLDLDKAFCLERGDVMFVDNSHVSSMNSDVTVFFLEILGRIPAGVLYGLHDIFLPYDYPVEWIPRFYSEQYLLAAYLFGGADGDRIVLPGSYISHDSEMTRVLDTIWKHPALLGILPYGGTMWMERGARS